jgi:hypothetical protein
MLPARRNDFATIRRWIAEEILPSTKLGGARIVAMVDLEAVLSPSKRMIRDASEQYDTESEI